MADELLTAQEAADFLKLKKSTVYEMIKRGELPSAKIGKQLRINRSDLEALLPGGATRAEEPAPAPVLTPRRRVPEGGPTVWCCAGRTAAWT